MPMNHLQHACAVFCSIEHHLVACLQAARARSGELSLSGGLLITVDATGAASQCQSCALGSARARDPGRRSDSEGDEWVMTAPRTKCDEMASNGTEAEAPLLDPLGVKGNHIVVPVQSIVDAVLSGTAKQQARTLLGRMHQLSMQHRRPATVSSLPNRSPFQQHSGASLQGATMLTPGGRAAVHHPSIFAGQSALGYKRAAPAAYGILSSSSSAQHPHPPSSSGGFRRQPWDMFATAPPPPSAGGIRRPPWAHQRPGAPPPSAGGSSPLSGAHLFAAQQGATPGAPGRGLVLPQRAPQMGASGRATLPAHMLAGGPPPPPTAGSMNRPTEALRAIEGGPPSTAPPPQRVSVGARSLMGTYPGKSANQDRYLMQPLQRLTRSSGPSAPPPGTPLAQPPRTAREHFFARSQPPPRTAQSGLLSSGGAVGGYGSWGRYGAGMLGGGESNGASACGSERASEAESRDAAETELYATAGGDAIMGVYDGHGQHGHHVSRFIKERLATEISKLTGAQLGDGRSAERELMAAHHRTNEALKQSGIDVSLSGSTACTALKRGRRLLIANVGDSRCVLGREDQTRPGTLIATDLSIDQKPDAPAERARIEGGGGQVRPSLVPGVGYAGPPRVWDPTRRFGLACSRSMGDTLYYGPNRSGVIAEPEVTSHRLDQHDRFLIIGSDGVWDKVTSQEAVELAKGCKDVEQASDRITQVARDRWRQSSPMADDITAVVVALS
jgi:serine/threonine protein phosphatase PrpC